MIINTYTRNASEAKQTGKDNKGAQCTKIETKIRKSTNSSAKSKN